MADLALGELIDPAAHKRNGTAVKIPTSDLTTHGVIVGMTGSGKTGLAVVLLEEALSANVPAILIDPKGDLANLALVFPGLSAAEFEPWVDPGQAASAGQSVADFAAAQAKMWADGLQSWGIGPDRLKAFHENVDVNIFTPGSTAGLPVNIVGSLQAPADVGDVETMRDEIEGYVSGLLGLVGVQADPLSSREHILLSNLIETSWTAGRSLDLPGLVGQVPNPPIRKLGVFEIDQFFPANDRMALAMKLNGLLASTSFAAWSKGDPLDVGALLRGPDGRPRCSIVSIAHLSDDERQFVVSLLLSKVVTWMRKQSGTTDLRALVYMDEVAGYVPPSAMPPTKKPIMTLMKQARAFGLGVVLATQNPVDVDYKALSNAGTWLIGRLQTERDKARLLDGMSAAAGTVDVSAVGDTISGLGKREFVLKRAGKDKPEVMTSRWAMSYLRGPLTRDQISDVMADRKSAVAAAAPADAAPAAPALPDNASSVMPKVADGVIVRWVDPAAPWVGAFTNNPTNTHFDVAAVARMRLRYDDTKAGIDQQDEYEVVLYPLEELMDVADAVTVDYDDRDLRSDPPDGATYTLPEAPIDTKPWWAKLQKDLLDQVSRSKSLEIQSNASLKLFSRPGESSEQFTQRCTDAANAGADADAAKLRDKYQDKLKRLEDQLAQAQDRVAVMQSEKRGRLGQEVLSTAGSILGGFLGGRNKGVGGILSGLGGAAGRRGRSATASKREDLAKDKADQLAQDHDELEKELADELQTLHDAWMTKAADIQTVRIALEKSDVTLAQIVLVWVPAAS